MKQVNRIFTTLLFAGALSVAIHASVASAHRGRVFGPSFGSPGSGPGQLSLSSFGGSVASGGSGLAVDENTHAVYVADTGNERVDEFTSTGAFVRAWGWGVVNGAPELQVCTETTGCRAGLSGVNPGELENPAFVTVDDSPGGEGDVYVANLAQSQGPNRTVQKFTAAGALLESWGNKGQINENSPAPERFGQISGVAVTSVGELVVGTNNGIFEFDQSSGAFIKRFGEDATEFPNQVGIDGAGNFYYELYEEFRKLGPDGSPKGDLFNILSPKLPGLSFIATGLAVAKSGELYVDERSAIQVISSSCVSQCAPLTTFSSPLLTDGAGLSFDSSRETLFIAEVGTNKIENIVPEPPSTPLVEAGTQSVAEVSGDSATLEAVINPRSEASEGPTSYRFQYTSEESYQREGFASATVIPVSDGQLAPSFEGDLVTAHVQGLQADTNYRFRVIAENAISRGEGKQTEGERNEAGEEVARAFTTQTPGVFSLPDGRAWELVSPADKHGALINPTYENGVVDASAAGDAFTYLTTASTESTPEGESNNTQVLSTLGAVGATSWTTRDIATPREAANGLNLLSNPDEYRFFSNDLSLAIVNPFGKFDPSLSTEASEQTAFLRTDFPSGEPADICSSKMCYHPLVTGAPGFANVPEGTEFGEGRCDKRFSQECGPQFVDATPDASHIILLSSSALTEGAPAESLYEWTAGQLRLISVLPNGEPALKPELGLKGLSINSRGNVRNAFSTDGSRVVWMAGKSLYLRDTVSEETVQLSNASAEFEDASSDDTRVFFAVAGDLYVFEAPAGSVLSAGHTTNLTPAGELLSPVMGASQDGSSVYFVTESVLSSSEANARGETALAGQPNLYLNREGVTKIVAVLSKQDSGGDWQAQFNFSPSLGKLTARVSPNGQWLAFMSKRPLTGYDNRDVSSGERDEEVFLYDATANGGRGGVVCASCDPTGARPHGLLDVTHGPVADAQGVWRESWLAGNIPGWISSTHQSRYLSDSGRMFFNSDDALVPSDTNGTEDVYEYEPSGVGDCTGASLTFSTRSRGCADLISSGTSKEESVFMDASESGDDVFFLTSAQLSKQDVDSVVDVYDARVGGGFPEPQAPPACEGDACQSPVAAPNDQTPGSLTYSGPGNPIPLMSSAKVTKRKTVKCAKGKKLSRGKCVKVKKKAAKSKRSKKAGRAGTKRGAKS